MIFYYIQVFALIICFRNAWIAELNLESRRSFRIVWKTQFFCRHICARKSTKECKSDKISTKIMAYQVEESNKKLFFCIRIKIFINHLEQRFCRPVMVRDCIWKKKMLTLRKKLNITGVQFLILPPRIYFIRVMIVSCLENQKKKKTPKN